MKTKALRLFAGLCAAIFAFTSIGFATAPAPERDERRFEVDFLKNMIDHHYGAIKMPRILNWLGGIDDLLFKIRAPHLLDLSRHLLLRPAR